MDDQKEIRKEAARIISDALGNETGLLYDLYLKNKTIEEILIALEDLLNEYLGDKKTKEIIDELHHKYKN